MSMDLRDSGSSGVGFAVLCVICAFAQLAISPNLNLFGGCANFALILTACVAMSEGGSKAIITGFCAGLFFDLSTVGPMGLMCLELTVLGALVGASGRNRFAESPLALARVYALSAASVELAYQLCSVMVGHSGSLWDALVFRFLPGVFLDLVFFVPFAFFYLRQVTAGSSLGFGGKGRRGRFDTPGL